MTYLWLYFTSSPAIIPGCMWNKDKSKKRVIIKDSWKTGPIKVTGGSWQVKIFLYLPAHPPPISLISRDSYSACRTVTGLALLKEFELVFLCFVFFFCQKSRFWKKVCLNSSETYVKLRVLLSNHVSDSHKINESGKKKLSKSPTLKYTTVNLGKWKYSTLVR